MLQARKVCLSLSSIAYLRKVGDESIPSSLQRTERFALMLLFVNLVVM